MNSTKYTLYREVNPYAQKRDPRVSNPHFYTNEQERVYKELYKQTNKKTKVVLQHHINVHHMRTKHPDYFRETLAMCEEFGLLNIMTVEQPYIEYYIH